VQIRAKKGKDAVTFQFATMAAAFPRKSCRKCLTRISPPKPKARIGLYMSKMIMDNMGGEIAIQNVEGGAEVSLTLPLAGSAV